MVLIEKDKLEKLKKLSKEFNLSFLVLFGSRANGSFTNNSDWDFAYFTNKKIDKIKLWNKLEILFKNVDLVEINGLTSIYLKKEISDNGFLIYEKRLGLFEDFKAEVDFEYMDNIDYLKEYENFIEKNLKL